MTNERDDEILGRALGALSSQARRISPLFALLPGRFTLGQLQGCGQHDIEVRAFKILSRHLREGLFQ